MIEELTKLAEVVAKKFNLDKAAVIGQNPEFYYISIDKCLIEVESKTHLSRCVSRDAKAIAAFNAIQTLKYC